MPYIIISTIALAANLYKKTPIIVGDRSSDPMLMKHLGAQVTCNYPTCGSPAVYIVHDTPTNVLNALEKKGYTIQSTEIMQEHLFWVLRTDQVSEDEEGKAGRTSQDKKKEEEAAPAE